MKTVDGQLGVEQFKTLEIRAEARSGFAKIEQKHNLTPLKVLIGNNKIPAGATVYVPGEACKAAWASKILKIGDIEFILMPEGFVLVVDVPSEVFTATVATANGTGYGVVGVSNPYTVITTVPAGPLPAVPNIKVD